LTEDQPINVDPRVITGLRSAEERCKSLMESSQVPSRGAQEFRSHDHISEKVVRDYEQARSSRLSQ
jgi:hypothetical protein